MRFRPCIDIHNGQVKQLVGGTLKDEGDQARENYVSAHDASYYARLYAEDGLSGGHVILLNPETSPYYNETLSQALAALSAAPGRMMAGGGIRPDNAARFLQAGASHVIVTSYVFRDGRIDQTNLDRIVSEVGAGRLVLDVSARRKGDTYYVVTDRWQKMTQEPLTAVLLEQLQDCCSEFLIHAVDAEGRQAGPQLDLIRRLADYDGRPVTYAGGIRSLEDIGSIFREGKGRFDVTVGSALDLFGGQLPYRQVLTYSAFQ